MNKHKFDFGGWATRNDLLCADGRTIRKNAFRDDDGRTVPLVWQHNHDDPTRVIGHALLENRPEGVYAYCSFNNTDMGQHVKELVRHQDVNSLSIYANKLKQAGGDVLHGVIREVSVVLAGANPGAVIEFPIMEHGEESETEAVIWPGEENLDLGVSMGLYHADEDDKEDEDEDSKDADKEEAEDTDDSDDSDEGDEDDSDDENEEKLRHADDGEETVQDVLNSMNKKQREVVNYLIAQALEGENVAHADSDEDDGDDSDDGETVADVMDTLNDKQRKVAEFLIGQALAQQESSGEEDSEEAKHSYEDEEEFTMKKNVFDNSQMTEETNDTLTHAQLLELASDAKRLGSLRESVLAHAQDYGIEQIDYLMPEYREVTGGAPQFIKRDDTWVAKIMRGVHHTPFAKVKMTFADITKDQARARGYIKGHRKSEEVFKLLKREIGPTTVYKKQKLDRDDMIDISEGFDKVAWLKGEMRMMLDEELARAYIIGDGRAEDSEDKIDEANIIPVLKDDSLYVIRQEIAPEQGQAHGDALIDAVTYGMEEYQGSGNCIALMTRREYSQLRLLKDKMGRRIYNNDSEINSALGVREILFVPQMGDASTVWHDTKANKYYKPLVIILDLDDYNVGADKGGSVNMFEDFDIDYNQQKYLIETRCSGGLTKPYSALIVTEEVEAPANP